MSWSSPGGPGRLAGDGAVAARAPAKVNVHLAVGPLRSDGFHELRTVYLAVSLFDTVTARPGEGITLTVRGEGSGTGRGPGSVPTDRRNLVWRAAELLARHAGVSADVHLEVDKSIPAAAGLAGGSADAAATLVALVRRPPPPGDRAATFAVIDAAFATRRKGLRAALARWAGSPVAAEARLRAAGIDPTTRGEQLSVTDFARLAAT